MATSQMRRNQQKTGNWSTMFPVDQVTQTQSSLFVKKLLAVAISNITYLRTVFPEHAFGDRCLEDLNLKILRDDSACPGACQVIQWVRGCFDALDKQYLKMIVIAIYKDSDDPNTIVESYTFKFSYNSKDEGGISIYRNGSRITGATSPSETRKATIKLLRTIVVLTQTLKPLPDDVMMTMKLFYYDEGKEWIDGWKNGWTVTPSDYEPPGFEATSDDEFLFKEEPLNIRVGDVTTPFHIVKLRIKTECQQFALKEEDNNTVDIADKTIEVHDTTHPIQDDTTEAISDGLVAIEPVEEGGQSPPLDAGLPMTQISEEPIIVRCPCDFNKDEGLMILCGLCHKWQHAACFGLLEEETVPELHVCEMCGMGHTHSCTDPNLVTLTPAVLQSHCLWRRALLACLDMNRIVPHVLAKRMEVELNVAQGLVNRLEREGYVQQPTKSKSRHWKIVLKDVIHNNGLKKYFLNVKGDVKKMASQVDDGLDQLTEKASTINISATNTDKAMQPPKGLVSHIMEEQKDPVRRSPRLAKRAHSSMDPSVEFEISESQDFDTSQEVTGRRKRRKASVASRAILV